MGSTATKKCRKSLCASFCKNSGKSNVCCLAATATIRGDARIYQMLGFLRAMKLGMCDCYYCTLRYIYKVLCEICLCTAAARPAPWATVDKPLCQLRRRLHSLAATCGTTVDEENERVGCLTNLTVRATPVSLFLPTLTLP